jgi:peptide/nickel transport system permease protein
LVFAVKLGWLPASGYVSLFDDPVESVRRLALPAIALGSFMGAQLMRQLRGSIVAVRSQDFMRTARAKGLSEWGALRAHGLRNAILPTLTVFGVLLVQTLGGSLIVEVIFVVPGLGRLLVNSVFLRDFPVVQAGALLIAVVALMINLGVDVLYGIIDPRIGRRG